MTSCDAGDQIEKAFDVYKGDPDGRRLSTGDPKKARACFVYQIHTVHDDCPHPEYSSRIVMHRDIRENRSLITELNNVGEIFRIACLETPESGQTLIGRCSICSADLSFKIRTD